MRLFVFSFLFFLSFSLNAEIMRVTILGSGTPRPDIKRFSQSILVEAGEQKLLFDSGRGAVIRLNQMNVDIAKVQSIFFTHLHSDHILGFPDLLLTGWIYRRNEILNIYGPKGIGGYVKNIKKAYQEDINIRTQKPESLDIKGLRTKINVIEEGLIYNQDDVKVFAIEVDHGGGVNHAYAYKIIYKNKAVLISGDTNYSENLVKAAKNVDLLIHEIASAPKSLISKSEKVKGIMNYHTTPIEMSKIINQSQPKFVVLNHVLLLGGISESDVLNEIEKNLTTSTPIKIAFDLMAIDLSNKINVYSVDYTK